MALARQQQDDAESRQRGKHISDDIKHGRAIGRGGIDMVPAGHPGQHGQQEKTHLRDG